ncbi:Zinc metalloprotease RasP [Bienertia sinuspersici]
MRVKRNGVGGKGCFNVECPGFVQVAKDVLIGKVADKISERGKFQYGWRLSIDKRKDDGNWWVSIDNDKYGIGYWPKSLFTSLADHANQVEWGGEVYTKSSGEFVPEMGCGFNPDYNTNNAAFYSLTKLVDGGYNEIDPPRSTVKYANCPSGYTVQDMGYQGPDWGRIILFGGPKNP